MVGTSFYVVTCDCNRASVAGIAEVPVASINWLSDSVFSLSFQGHVRGAKWCVVYWWTQSLWIKHKQALL